MEVISQPPTLGKTGKGESAPAPKDYETCSEEEVGKKPGKSRLAAPSTILKDMIDIVEDVSSSPPILGTKRKKGLKEGRKKKLAIRFGIPV